MWNGRYCIQRREETPPPSSQTCASLSKIISLKCYTNSFRSATIEQVLQLIEFYRRQAQTAAEPVPNHLAVICIKLYLKKCNLEQIQCIAVNDIQATTTQHNTTQHDATRHDTTRHSTTQHDTTQHDTTRHNTTRHNTTRHDTTRHDTARHNMTRNNTIRHDTTQQNTTQHDTTRHNTTRHNRSQKRPLYSFPTPSGQLVTISLLTTEITNV